LAGNDYITLREMFAGGYLSERAVEYLESSTDRDWGELKIHVGDRGNEGAIQMVAAGFESMAHGETVFELVEAGADFEEQERPHGVDEGEPPRTRAHGSREPWLAWAAQGRVGSRVGIG
jgi:hypothetical protein